METHYVPLIWAPTTDPSNFYVLPILTLKAFKSPQMSCMIYFYHHNICQHIFGEKHQKFNLHGQPSNNFFLYLYNVQLHAYGCDTLYNQLYLSICMMYYDNCKFIVMKYSITIIICTHTCAQIQYILCSKSPMPNFSLLRNRIHI